MIAESPYLDLLSTSQTAFERFSKKDVTCAFPKCSYFAPYFAYANGEKSYGVVQGCCNHWDCPRCGIQRAKSEYGRIVVGIEALAQTNLICFITITCRGKDVSKETAENSYLLWTNRFLTACRSKALRCDREWYYVQVTERQKRGHPHSHILTTFYPNDLRQGFKVNWKHEGGLLVSERIPCLRSAWLQSEAICAGLGSEYDVSMVKTAAAASRYVAKYMFKPSMFGTHWPKGWKRVRYSQNFPTLPTRETNAFILMSGADWDKLAQLALFITTSTPLEKQECLYRLRGHDILVS